MEDDKLNEEKDSLKMIFESMDKEIFTEDVQLKMQTLFESAVNEAVEKKEKELEEANAADLTVFKADLVEQIDDYMDYFVKDYIKENEVVVEDFSKVKLAEKVLRNFNQMVEAFNISLSDESIDAEDEIEKLKTECNKLTNNLIESKKENEDIKRAAIISEASVGATDLQIEQLIETTKKLDFETLEIFETKVKTIMEKITEEIVKPAVALQIAENKSQDEPQALSDLKPVTVTLENPIVSNRAMIYLGGWLFVIILIIIGYLITKKKRKTVNKLN